MIIMSENSLLTHIQCLKKGQECAYIPSRRGGARTTRRFTQNGMRNGSEEKQTQPRKYLDGERSCLNYAANNSRSFNRAIH